MGNDGGSIPKRRELVKTHARAPTVSQLKATARESLGHAWTHCHLSAAPLTATTPVASDARGLLYSYEAVLAALAADTASPDTADADAADALAALDIRSLRDVLRLHPTPATTSNTAPAPATGTGVGVTSVAAPLAPVTGWVCPVSLKPLGPAVRAVYLVPCGHVFAEAALRELSSGAAPADTSAAAADAGAAEAAAITPCPECATPTAATHIIPLLSPASADAERLAARMCALRAAGLAHSLKKDKAAGKKSRKRKGEADAGADERKRAKPDRRVDGINNEFAKAVTAKVLAEQDELQRRRKAAGV